MINNKFLSKQVEWPPGSADMVCPRPLPILTFDRLTLKLVCKSHLSGELSFRIWAR